MRKLAAILALILASPLAFAVNAVYIAQTAAGSANGTSCANAYALTYFNTSGNWSATPTGTQIGPDTTVHLCGTFTAAAATSGMLAIQGNGTSGHPVTILFDPGRKRHSALLGHGRLHRCKLGSELHHH